MSPPRHALVSGLVLLLAAACERVERPPVRGSSTGGGDRLFREGRAATLPDDATAPLHERPWAVDVGWERRLSLVLDPGVTHDWTPEGRGDLGFGLGAAGAVGRAPGPTAEVAWFDASGQAVGDVQQVTATPGQWIDLRMRWPAGARRVRFRGLEGRAFLSEPRRMPARPAAPRPDVVLVSLDTVGRERLSLYGHRRPTSPRLDAWARRRAVVFDDALAAAGGTLPSHASLLSGRSPLFTGVIEGALAAFSPDLRLLAEHFRSAGYRTAALVGGGFLHPEFGFARGFDRYAWTERPATEALADQVAAAVRLLDEDDGRPLFLFLHTYAAHEPYVAHGRFEPPPGCDIPGLRLRFALDPDQVRPAQPAFEDAQGRPLPPPADARACVEWLYDEGLAELDAGLAPLLDRLERLDRPRVVGVTADHGEATGAGNLYGHGWLDPAVMRVPLALAGPDWPAGTRRRDLACGEDVAATLLDAAALVPERALDGRPLFGHRPARGCDLVAPNPWLTIGRRRAEGGLVRVNVAPGLQQSAGWHPRFTRAGEAPTPMAPSSGDAGPLLAALEERGRGRRLTVVHDGRGSLEVEVRTSPEAVWAALPPCECVDATVEDVYRVRLVAAGRVHLALTERAAGRLLVRVAGASFAFDLGRSPLHEELFEDTAGWARRAAGAHHVMPRGVRLDWPGSLPSAPTSGADEQLRALGYVR